MDTRWCVPGFGGAAPEVSCGYSAVLRGVILTSGAAPRLVLGEFLGWSVSVERDPGLF